MNAGRNPVVAESAAARSNRLAERLEQTGFVWCVALSMAYWAVTVALAGRKLMWNDELYTYYLARLPTMHDVWAALMARGEQTPPLFYLATRGAIAIAGDSPLALRLPEMLAVWIASACLYVFVRRRATLFPALCAAAFPLVTAAYPYAFEARAYGLLLGCAALSLLAWQTATMSESRSRVPALIGLTIALAATVCSHYYGVFVLMPVALGEGVRTLRRGRIDVAIWAALAVAIVPLYWHLELIRAGTAYTGAFWSPPQWVNLPDFYSELLTPAVIPVTVVLAVATLYALASASPTAASDRDTAAASEAPPMHELAAAFGFVLIPAVCLVVAKLFTGAFVNRYALSAVLGFGLLAGFGLSLSCRRQPALRLLAVVCISGWFVLSQAREMIDPTGVSLPVSRASIDRAAAWIAQAHQPTLPIVVADPHSFTVLSHYASPAIQSRLVYLADPDLALRALGNNSVERGMLDLIKPWFGMNVTSFVPYVDEHSTFLVYGDFVRRAFLNWIVPELQARGMRVELLNREGDDMLLLVSRDPLAARDEAARSHGRAAASGAPAAR